MNEIVINLKKAATEVAKVVIDLTVNGHAIKVPMGATVLDAIKAAGCRVPTLCYHPKFKPEAVCRMCLVDVGKNKLVPSCYTPAEQGMVIKTDLEELKAFQKRNLQFILSRHPNDCMKCEASGQCKLQDLVNQHQVEEIWPKITRGSKNHPEHVLHDTSSPAITRSMDKCIECGLCVQACDAQKISAVGFAERGRDRVPITCFDKPLLESGCISCGQCTLRCPVGALTEHSDWQRVMEVLENKKRITVVQTAPATRVAISEEFGLKPGSMSTGRMVNALRALGFDYVLDTDFTADLTILEEANELLARVKGEVPHGKLPMFTSCCPGWINYVEIYRPDLIPHLSTCKSPQQMHGSMTKYGPFAQKLSEEPFCVSIMPCTAKKEEAVRPAYRGDVDAVLTTRELAKMIKARNIPFASLSNEGEYDSPLGESTGAAVIFGASGGVLEAALRTAADVLGIKDAPIDWMPLRGVNEQVKTAHVPGVGTVAVCNSIAAAIDLLSNDKWKEDYIMIEVMTCPGGCLGGGGEPKSDDPNILEKRMKGIYDIDANMKVRKSHENEQVKKLYDDFLGHPLSEKSEQFLHAVYAERYSPRDKLMRFLAAVDQREGEAAATFFKPDGIWHTNYDGIGDLKGRDDIISYINSKLPPVQNISVGTPPIRHKMVDHAHGTDVFGPFGGKSHFDVILDKDTGLIESLTRIPLSESG